MGIKFHLITESWKLMLYSIKLITNGHRWEKKKPLDCESLSHVRLSATPWTAAHKVPLSIRFPRQEYWSGLTFPSLGVFLTRRSSPGLQLCRQLLYCLNHQSCIKWEWAAFGSIEPWFAKSEFNQYVSMISSINQHLAKETIHIHGAIYVNYFKNQNITIILYGHRCVEQYETWTGKTYTNFQDKIWMQTFRLT